jgi:hypothetical protein
MNVREREEAYIQKQRRKAMGGDYVAMQNIVAAYRILGKTRLAFRWFKKAADLGDGDALLEVGYCHQHGAGVRKDLRSAEQAYRAAIESRDITPFGREEAMYHLAVLLLSGHRHASRKEAKTLLRRANADDDYLQARELLGWLQSSEVGPICACRRGLRRRLARLKCAVHRGSLANTALQLTARIGGRRRRSSGRRRAAHLQDRSAPAPHLEPSICR